MYEGVNDSERNMLGNNDIELLMSYLADMNKNMADHINKQLNDDDDKNNDENIADFKADNKNMNKT